jgi:hypothetical protein
VPIPLHITGHTPSSIPALPPPFALPLSLAPLACRLLRSLLIERGELGAPESSGPVVGRRRKYLLNNLARQVGGRESMIWSKCGLSEPELITPALLCWCVGSRVRPDGCHECDCGAASGQSIDSSGAWHPAGQLLRRRPGGSVTTFHLTHEPSLFVCYLQWAVRHGGSIEESAPSKPIPTRVADRPPIERWKTKAQSIRTRWVCQPACMSM